jgi:hypothetical protein
MDLIFDVYMIPPLQALLKQVCSVTFRFKIKYHPEDSVKRRDEQMTALKVWFSSHCTTMESPFNISQC